MIEKLKWYMYVFFARIRTKKAINRLEQDLQDYSWHLCVEKLDLPELVVKYKEAEVNLFIKKNILKGLRYF